MKRCICVLGAALTLALGTGAANALAGGLPGLPNPPISLGGSQSNTQTESVSNSTDQAANQSDSALNVPVNIALLNSGGVNQSNGGVNQSNGNANATSQDVAQNEGSTQQSTGESQGSNPGYDGDSSAPQSNGSQSNGSQSNNQSESTSNETSQDAQQNDTAVNMPVNVAVANGGGTYGGTYGSKSGCDCDNNNDSGVTQSNGGVDQSNGNLNLTSQDVGQNETSSQQSSGTQDQGWSSGKGNDGCGCQQDGKQGAKPGSAQQSNDQQETVSNDTGQQADQSDLAENAPINVAAFNDGGVHQSNGGVDQSNGNVNVTGQNVHQSETSSQQSSGTQDQGWSSGKGNDGCGCQKDGKPQGGKSSAGSQSNWQDESVTNTTGQTATQDDSADNAPANLAFGNGGGNYGCSCDRHDGGSVKQSNGGISQSNGNLNETSQYVDQKESSTQSAGGGQSRWAGESKSPSQSSHQSETVSNETYQDATQDDYAANYPVNGEAFGSGSVRQQNGGVNQSNGNANATSQYVWQNESSKQQSSGGPDKGFGGKGYGNADGKSGTGGSQSSRQSETVSNETNQTASQYDAAENVPVNAAFGNGFGKSVCRCDRQDGSSKQSNGGVSQSNGNFDKTTQVVGQNESSTQSSEAGNTGHRDCGSNGKCCQHDQQKKHCDRPKRDRNCRTEK